MNTACSIKLISNARLEEYLAELGDDSTLQVRLVSPQPARLFSRLGDLGVAPRSPILSGRWFIYDDPDGSFIVTRCAWRLAKYKRLVD